VLDRSDDITAVGEGDAGVVGGGLGHSRGCCRVVE